ncbi:hypothetical protein OPIT5_13315 [Opitutaceae bacterium TAV5]|nr:hypothetical protein OPIT5_13315 [Opitutaceae bacterium TAV5]
MLRNAKPRPPETVAWLAIATLALAGAGQASACGPFFPNTYLAAPDSVFVNAPEGFFGVEIERISPSGKIVVRSSGNGSNPEDEEESAEESDGHRREIDNILPRSVREELQAALSAAGTGPADAEKILRAYAARLGKEQETSRNKNTDTEGPTDGKAAPQLPPWPEWPAKLPAEFALYLRGAEAWHAGDVDKAADRWRALLELPAGERRHRAVWAAYMLGRVALERMPEGAEASAAAEEANRRFLETERLAAEGFSDALDLRGSAAGTRGRLALRAGDFAQALGCYLDQYATGDGTALASLQQVVARVADAPPETLDAVAADRRARQVVTLWFLSRFHSSYDYDASSQRVEKLHRWADALARAGARDMAEASRLAWLAYEGGDTERARTWLEMARPDEPEVRWIRAKLALREGRLAEAASHLQLAAADATLAAPYREQVLAELGRVRLSLGDASGSLRAWMDGGHWADAAYVAERVLPLDELRAFVDGYLRPPLPVTGYGDWYWTPRRSMLSERPVDNPPQALRALLARRLARENKPEEAMRYFSADTRELYAGYIAQVRAGFDISLSATERADAFWRAARIIREHGMELIGTELEPDYAIWGGNYWQQNTVAGRLALHGPLAPPAAEREQTEDRNRKMPTKRFSYRYRAADLAWWAASLLPNDDERTAEILTTAGGWLRWRDPSAANRFYQALVIRCGNTPAGRAATEKRWFP